MLAEDQTNSLENIDFKTLSRSISLVENEVARLRRIAAAITTFVRKNYWYYGCTGSRQEFIG